MTLRRHWLPLVVFLVLACHSGAQTLFLSLDNPGQYSASFNPWNDSGGGNGGNYAFAEGATAGVGGSGGVSVFQNTDTSANCKTQGWDISTNGATVIISALMVANGQVSGDKTQIGIVNSIVTGFYSNPGIQFESFRFVPASGTSWTLYEQYRNADVTTTSGALGTVPVVPGRWYKFVVGLTNVGSGNLSSACALIDYGTNGLVPGTNVITFPTVQTRAGLSIATNATVWTGIRAFQDSGISAWDNFLVFTTNSAPVFTLSLSNTVAVVGSPATFSVLADGPGPITYAWYTNKTLVPGTAGSNYTFTPANTSLTNVLVIASNSKGSVTNQASVSAPALAVLTNSPATGIQAAAATLGGAVVATGGSVPQVTIYYGTNNAGANAAGWAMSAALGAQTGTFSQSVGNLSPSTLYYFTARAVNAAGASWASPVGSFLTLTPTAPLVANSPATGIKASQAILNGQVLSSGGLPTTVMLYYGTTNGGTNPAAWAASVSVGAQSGGYSQPIGSLATNTTYYFTARASNSVGVAWAAGSLQFTTLATNPPSALTAVLTYHNDNTRQGVNTNETTLTLANVNTNTFGKLFDCTVDGFVYAQPLVVPEVSIPGKGTHNVVYVATEHNSVYAFDADTNTGSNSVPLWQTSFLGPGVTTVPAGVVGSTDITPEIGITATPVIDAASGTLYVHVKTQEGSAYVHRLHALNIATGQERTEFGSPVVITYTNYPGVGNGASSGQFADNDGKNPPHVLWNPLREHCRTAFTLLNGVVYVAFASHGDTQPYHGWIFGYNATNLTALPSAYNVTPNGFEGGIWQAGGGPSVDDQGNLYIQTGNGSFNGGSTVTATNNYSMSLIKLATTNGLTLVDYFAPSNAVSLSASDQDLGASAPIILPDSAGSAAHPHLVVGGGKTPPVYLADRDNMGRFNGTSGNNLIVQQFNGGAAGDRDLTPAFFNNTMYMVDVNWKIAAFSITNGLFNTTPVVSPDRYDNRGGVTPAISANGASNAILWAIYNAGGASPTTPCILRAYNATNITQRLYSSDQLPARDAAGDAVKFTVPTIANGKVYVGAQYRLSVYGTAQSFVSTPVISPNGGFFINSVLVTISDATPGASIYYTLDGTIPTTASMLYAGPFVLTNSATVIAGAFKAGSTASAAVSASFVNTAMAGTGTGLRGEYYSNQVASFTPPPSLVRTDAFVSFNWQGTSPDPAVSSTNFSVRWSGCVQPQYAETYTFYTWSDAGVRLWINGQLLIDAWSNQPPTLQSASISMAAQQIYNIELDYFYQNQGPSVVQLSWSSPSTPQQVIPQSQLYPFTNPPPAVVISSPTNGAAYTGPASITVGALAAAQSNDVAAVALYANGQLLGSLTAPPYALTTSAWAAGAYSLTAVAIDTSGLAATSAPVNITVSAGTGLPYGMSNYPAAPAFYNMPNQFTGPLPPLLSQTGVFTNTAQMSPAAAFLPYSPNVPLWSDGALKSRFVSIPNSGPPYTPSAQIGYAPTGSWSFPAGTVFVKTFEILTNQSDPDSVLRLETRLLVRDIAGAVYGVTYKWRADNSEANLLATSQTQAVTITAPSGTVTQTWYYPSPNDCLQCHTPVANYVLGLNARQLNGDLKYPNGVTDNQLRTLNRLGLLYPAIDEGSIPGIPQMAALTNSTASLEQRARSYLDANCAQCHQPGGNGPTFDARYDTPLNDQHIIDVLAVKGNLGYDNVRIVAPKDVWRSSIYDRMNSLNPAVQMPNLARNVIDTNAVQLMSDWINSLPGIPALPPPTLAPPGGTFVGFVNVSALAPTNDVVLRYTLDGSLPTTNSPIYYGPIQVTSNLTLNVNAWAPGFTNSVVGTASFTILPGVYFLSATLTNGTFQMTSAGAAGSNYVLQASTNLVEWFSLSTNTPSASPFILSDPAATSAPVRFYRILQQ